MRIIHIHSHISRPAHCVHSDDSPLAAETVEHTQPPCNGRYRWGWVCLLHASEWVQYSEAASSLTCFSSSGRALRQPVMARVAAHTGKSMLTCWRRSLCVIWGTLQVRCVPTACVRKYLL